MSDADNAMLTETEPTTENATPTAPPVEVPAAAAEAATPPAEPKPEPKPVAAEAKPAADPKPAAAEAKPILPAAPPKPAAPAAPAAAPEQESKFAGLGLDPKLLAILTGLGYEEPTPIQREAIPVLLKGKDMVGMAATGTGKTAAFALPLLQRLNQGKAKGKPAAVILVPTRELAMQVAEAVHKYGRAYNTRVLPVYGGAAFGQQARALERGVDVIVATPGRALDHLRRGTLKLDGIAIAVLDEADEMLDMGFAEDIEAILKETPAERQTMLFSATMPPRIEAIARRHLTSPTSIRVAQEKVAAGAMPRVRQTAYLVPRAYKLAALARILDVENPGAALIFCRTRTEVDELAETLSARGYRPEALHGGFSQEQRDRVMRMFRAGTADLLVATDVAARGLDVEHLTHVVNFHIPSEPEAYVHRIGRVGRAGREGVAITLAEPKEHRLLRNIERATARKIEVARIPTVADLKARRMEITRSNVREAILDADLDPFRVIVEDLSGEFDLMDIALAAVKLAHKAEVGDAKQEEQEIPSPVPPPERFPAGGPNQFRGGPNGPGGFNRGPDRGPPPPRFRDDRYEQPQQRPRRQEDEGEGVPPRFRAERNEDDDRGPAPFRGGDRPERERGPAPRGRGGPAGGVARVYFSVGRFDGVAPRDLVGAIANEAGVPGHDIGTIDMGDRFAVVELPEDAADFVIDSLNGTRIRGQRVNVRRDRGEGDGGGSGGGGGYGGPPNPGYGGGGGGYGQPQGPGGGGYGPNAGGPGPGGWRPPNPGGPRPGGGGRPSFRGTRRPPQDEEY